MSLGWIDPRLPDAKAVAVKALEAPYATREGALDSIRLAIREKYDKEYPSVAAAKKAEIERMIEEVQRIYNRNYFPGDAGELEEIPEQHRPSLLSGLLPLSRWQTRLR